MTIRQLFRWHDVLPLRDDIDRITAIVNRSYALVFGGAPHVMNGAACETGYTDFTHRLCWLNAEALHAPAAEQFVFTVYLAAHERAHARWTDYQERDFQLRDAEGDLKRSASGDVLFDRALHQTWNILEDERIERLLGRDFPALHPYLHAGSVSFLSIVRPANTTDDPSEVLRHILRRRIAQRTGRLTPCRLSPRNRALLRQCEPVLEEAYCETSSRRVVDLARIVLDILAIQRDALPDVHELSGQCGERQTHEADGTPVDGNDEVKSAGTSGSEGSLTDVTSTVEDDMQHQATRRMQALGYTPGYSPGHRSTDKIEPAPYHELQRSVRPYVSQVRPLFAQLPARRRVEWETSGGRVSIRAARQDLRAPFEVEAAPTSPGLVALTLVIDDSASMTDRRADVNAGHHAGHNPGLNANRTAAEEGKRMAMLCVDALPLPHRVRIVLAPSGRAVADPAFGEMSRARIAGYDSRAGTAYADVLDRELTRLQHLSEKSNLARYLVLVADGATNAADVARCRSLVTTARAAHVHETERVHLIGIGVGDPEAVHAFFRPVFGKQYIALTSMEALVPQMQRILQQIAHVSRRST
jgi:hypothetical protein